MTTAMPSDAVRGFTSVAHYRALGVPVGIATEDASILATIDASYGTFRATVADAPDASFETIRCAVPERGRWSIESASRPPRVVGSADDAAIDVLDRLVDAILRGSYEGGLVTIHAATVQTASGVLLIAAPSGGGKTTLALGLAARGHALLSDELAVIDADGGIRAYPRALHVRPDTLGLIPALDFLATRPRIALGGGNEWAVTPAELAERWDLPTVAGGPLAGVVLIEGRPGVGTATIEPLSAATAALELARGSWAASVDFGATLGRLATVVSDVPCGRLDNGPLEASLDAIERFTNPTPAGSVVAPTLGIARRAVLERWRADRVSTTIEAVGGSMLPLIEPGDLLHVDFGTAPGRIGDVVVFATDELVVAHRVVGRRADGAWLTKGDAEPLATEDVRPDEVLGVVRGIERPPASAVLVRGLHGRRGRGIAAISRTSGRLERASRRHGAIGRHAFGLAARSGRAVLSVWTNSLASAGRVDSPMEGGESA